MTIYTLYVLLGLIAMLIISMFRILREYERGVIFQLGRFWKVKGPGFIIVIPLIQQMVRVDLRTIVMDVLESLLNQKKQSGQIKRYCCSACTFIEAIAKAIDITSTGTPIFLYLVIYYLFIYSIL